ncbi:MAG: ATP-binding protein [Bacteroidia bacterium]
MAPQQNLVNATDTERFKAILNQVPAWVAYINADLLFEFSNNHNKVLPGLPGNDVHGKPINEALEPPALERLHPYIQKGLEGERVSSVEPVINTSGEQKTLKIETVPDKTPEGAVRGLLLMVEEVTKSIWKEKKPAGSSSAGDLRLGRQQLVVESIPQMAWTMMGDGVLDYHNQRWFEYTGMSIEEVRVKGWFPIVHPDDFLKLRRKWEKATEKKQPYEFELRLKNAADDKYYWHLLRSIPVRNEKDEIQMWVGTATNIHDQITFQEKLKESQEHLEKMVQERTAEIISANQELVNTNNELNRFAYVISHDLKAPLRGISSLATWLHEDYEKELGPEGREQLNLLMQRVKRMHDLIEGILQYSRAGRDMDEEAKKVNVKKVVEEVIASLPKPDSVSISVPSTMPVLEFQETKIYQVFQNLVSNAIKFNDKPKGKIEIGYEDEPGKYLFYVKDNGSGISENYHSRIFQLFQTLSAEEDTESTGVGLAIVKKIIEAAGGNIWVESTEGAGSTFFFTILKKQ